jgi:hypothetical protein
MIEQSSRLPSAVVFISADAGELASRIVHLLPTRWAYVPGTIRTLAF